MSNKKKLTARREFLGNMAAGAAALGLLNIPAPLKAAPFSFDDASDADMWFSKIKGKHRIMYDVVEPNEMMPFAWSRVFLLTNEKTGTPAKDCNVVVVLRHSGIPYAMDSKVWSKYKFGEVFKINDESKAPAVRNAFWKPKPGDFKVPGIGNVEIGINELQRDGVMFCVCNMALTVFSAVVAEQNKMDATAVYNEWKAAVLPGIQIVPSGVWAVGRAQEHGCHYCYAG